MKSNFENRPAARSVRRAPSSPQFKILACWALFLLLCAGSGGNDVDAVTPQELASPAIEAFAGL